MMRRIPKHTVQIPRTIKISSAVTALESTSLPQPLSGRPWSSIPGKIFGVNRLFRNPRPTKTMQKTALIPLNVQLSTPCKKLCSETTNGACLPLLPSKMTATLYQQRACLKFIPPKWTPLNYRANWMLRALPLNNKRERYWENVPASTPSLNSL